MRRGTTSLTVACTLSLGLSLGLGAASCATAIGLDQVSRVDCVEDCGADAGIDVGEEGPASDGTLGDAPAVDGAMADRHIAEASPPTCTPGLACDGGRCDDAGVCRPGCTSNAGCAAPKPVWIPPRTCACPAFPRVTLARRAPSAYPRAASMHAPRGATRLPTARMPAPPLRTPAATTHARTRPPTTRTAARAAWCAPAGRAQHALRASACTRLGALVGARCERVHRLAGQRERQPDAPRQRALFLLNAHRPRQHVRRHHPDDACQSDLHPRRPDGCRRRRRRHQRPGLVHVLLRPRHDDVQLHGRRPELDRPLRRHLGELHGRRRCRGRERAGERGWGSGGFGDRNAGCRARAGAGESSSGTPGDGMVEAEAVRGHRPAPGVAEAVPPT